MRRYGYMTLKKDLLAAGFKARSQGALSPPMVSVAAQRIEPLGRSQKQLLE